MACCGLTMEEIPELQIGSLLEKTISELLSTTPDDFIKIWIHVEGPAAVIEYARTIDPNIMIPSGKAHICDICRHMYHDTAVTTLVKKYPPPNIDKIIERYYLGTLLKSASRPHASDFADTNLASFRSNCSVDAAQKLVQLSRN
jgi:hypothetical protein